MMLAKDRFGRIGRQVKSNGIEAVTAPAHCAGPFRSVIVSEKSIEADDLYYKDLEAQERAKVQAGRMRAQAAQIAKNEQYKAGQARVMGRQAEVRRLKEKENAKWAKHFTKVRGQPEAERVFKSLQADFSLSEMVQDHRPLRPINRRADFDIMQIVGNPLTRDAKIYGAATDWDRFVRSTELDNDLVHATTEQVVGGTMLGRYMGEDVKMPSHVKEKIGRLRGSGHGKMSGMGEDEGGGFWSNLWEKTQEEILKQAPKAAIEAEIKKQQGYVAPSPAQQIVTIGPAGAVPVAHPAAPGTFAHAAQSMGVPSWALASVIGLLGVGVLFVGYKAVSGSRRSVPA